MNNIVKEIKEIEYDILEKDKFCYVKLQILLETVLNKFLDSKHKDVNIETLKQKIEFVCLTLDFKQTKVLLELNHKANSIKHNNGRDIDGFDQAFIIRYVKAYNDLCDQMFHWNSSYKIDLNRNYTNDFFKSKENASDINFNSNTNDLNKKLRKTKVPCGCSSQDFGFEINIKDYVNSYSNVSKFQESIYATIFNFLQRSRKAKKNKYIETQDINNGINSDYSKVYRYQMMLLFAIKHGLLQDGKLCVKDNFNDKYELDLAVKNINHYAIMLSTLCKKSIEPIAIEYATTGISISLADSNSDIYLYDYKFDVQDACREYWYADDLLYCINKSSDLEILNEFLFDFFGFDKFRKGQFEAVVNTLNNHNRSITIMPTGAGKSLVFYMNALLTASSTIVISPTKILVKDQIRNLQMIHGIDDCYSYDENNELTMDHKMIYVVPDDFKSYAFVNSLINFSKDNKISNVVLDEVHTLCNWSHDFRPFYLMLCSNLFKYVDKSRFLGFTATANYKVLSDLIDQLKISFKEVYQPMVYYADNFDFRFIKCNDEKDQMLELVKCVDEFIKNRTDDNDKMVVFTKSLSESNDVIDKLLEIDDYDLSLFDAEHTYSYDDFVNGNKHVLIADGDMGIGINLPNVKCTVHYGFPNSKAQYVQEIGRASRQEDKAYSIVLFQDKEKFNDTDKSLLDYNIKCEDLFETLKNGEDSNVSILFKSAFGKMFDFQSSTKYVFKILNELMFAEESRVIRINKDVLYITDIEKCFYVLYLSGIINNWYLKNQTNEGDYYLVELSNDEISVDSIKENAIRYLSRMKAAYIHIKKIMDLESIKDVVYYFQLWVSMEFLRSLREQINNSIDFFDYYSSHNEKANIVNELKDYFAVSLETIDMNQRRLSSTSIDEIFHMNYDNSLLHICEELLSNNYCMKVDLTLLLGTVYMKRDFSYNRFLRVIDNSSEPEKRSILENINLIYGKLEDQEKIQVLNKFIEVFGMEYTVNTIYSKLNKDIVYYGLLAKVINKYLED